VPTTLYSLREALPGLFASGEEAGAEQLPEWLPDRWLLRRAREVPGRDERAAVNS
jgi:hypothetical protein